MDGATVHGIVVADIAAALLAAAVAGVAGSFNYDRPSGIWGAGVEETNAMVDSGGPRATPNTRATMFTTRRLAETS